MSMSENLILLLFEKLCGNVRHFQNIIQLCFFLCETNIQIHIDMSNSTLSVIEALTLCGIGDHYYLQI